MVISEFGKGEVVSTQGDGEVLSNRTQHRFLRGEFDKEAS
jgi:hypothetical protein